ncbi:MAG: SurA N-terminal domain-containing protein [Polyangiaceae bacterium]|nr:SurA N-terminal domain-containing protein [Polyangiaceae bacterium]
MPLMFFPLTKLVRPGIGLAALLTLVAPAHAVIVERIVAVVGERPILLSDLRKRAKPVLVQIYAQKAAGGQDQTAQEPQLMKELLQRMVDERLVEQTAEKQKKTITVDEIDKILKQRADSLKLTVAQLIGEARKQGLSEQEYRDEIRRQSLEGKLLQVRLAGRVKVSDDDAKMAYAQWVKELGNEKLVEVRVLPMRMPDGASEEAIQAKMTQAAAIVERARKGEDFCALIQEFSDDAGAKAVCGSRGLQPITALIPAIRESVDGLKKGEVPAPIRFGNEALVILQVAQPPTTPSFEDVKPQMQERALNGSVEKMRKSWLEELRTGVYVDVRY